MRGKAGENDAENVELVPLQAWTRHMEGSSWGQITLRNEGNEMDADPEKGDTNSSAGTPRDGPHTSPEAISVTDSPASSAQVPPSPRSSMRHRAPESSFDENCGRPPAPLADRPQHEKLPWDQFRERCPRRS